MGEYDEGEDSRDASGEDREKLPRRTDNESPVTSDSDRSGRTERTDEHRPVTRNEEHRPVTRNGELQSARSGEDRPARSRQDRPAKRASDSPTRQGDSSTPVGRNDTRPGTRGGQTLTEVITAAGTDPVSVETPQLGATLVAIPEVSLEEFVYEHQIEEAHRTEPPRSIALFDLENTGSRPIRWRSARTKFIGDDGYTYRPAHLSLEPSTLGPGCHTRQVEIEPGSKARMVTLVERLPEGVSIEKVVQTVPAPGPGGNERLVFPIG